MWVSAVTLTGRFARLEPLGLHHAEGLLAAAGDPAIWTHLIRPMPRDLKQMRDYIAEALEPAMPGTRLPFTIIRLADGRAAGSTSFLNMSGADRTLEIGWTWLGREFQRTAVNTECKFLLLRHAFEELGAVRVQLKTDELNERSQRAIERIGAVREGVLRKYQTTQGGRHRNTVMYSIIDDEWPAARERLRSLLEPR